MKQEEIWVSCLQSSEHVAKSLFWSIFCNIASGTSATSKFHSPCNIKNISKNISSPRFPLFHQLIPGSDNIRWLCRKLITSSGRACLPLELATDTSVSVQCNMNCSYCNGMIYYKQGFRPGLHGCVSRLFRFHIVAFLNRSTLDCVLKCLRFRDRLYRLCVNRRWKRNHSIAFSNENTSM